MSIWSNWITREVFPVVRNTDCHLPQACHPRQSHHHCPRWTRTLQVRPAGSFGGGGGGGMQANTDTVRSSAGG